MSDIFNETTFHLSANTMPLKPTEPFKLGVFTKVEVRSDEDGFQGSWHTATIIACGVGICKVKYLCFFDDEGTDHLVDDVAVRNIRPLRDEVISNKFSLHYGLCVDAFYNDAWWEGVVFDHEDGCDKRSVFFPDLGDEMGFEIGMLRETWDWDECAEEWSVRGDWVFVNLVEEIEKESPVMVSVKQLWYDLRGKECFNKVGMWKCRDRGLWKEVMLEVIKCYFTKTVDHLRDSLGCLPDLESENGPLFDEVESTKNNLASAIVTVSDNGYRGAGLELTDALSTVTSLCAISAGKGGTGRELDEGKGKHKLCTPQGNRVWLPVENVIVCESDFCPDVIAEYLQIAENLRKKLTQKLRKHLLCVGWKIEYRKETYMTRLRYISPFGKVYMSLVKICEDLNKDSGVVYLLSEDKGSPVTFKDRSRNKLLGRPVDSPKTMVTSSTSNNNVVFQAEFCHEAIENWCKKINSNGSVEADSLKAKKHLSAMGWSFYYTYRETKRELRYLSPGGKVYNSLRKACEDCIKDNTNVKLESSGRSKLSKNMAIIESNDGHVKNNLMHETAPYQLKVDLQYQPNNVVVQLNEYEKEESRKKLNGFRKESVRGTNQRKRHVKHSSKPAVRASKRVRATAVFSPSQSTPRTVLSWLIDRSVVLPRSHVKYICRKNGQALKTGKVSREGILCDCCGKIYSLSAFEAHAGSSVHRPSANIFLVDGRSLMECQRQMLNKTTELSTEKKTDQKGKRVCPENDELCSLCHYAGELMMCDRCPASFHMVCLGLKEIPDGDWFCPSCRCAICGLCELDDIICHGDVLRCYQCEQQYHMNCLKQRGTNMDMDDKDNRFCGDKCKKIYSGLNNLLGRPFALGSDNLTWTLVAANKCDSKRPDLDDMDTLTENYSKLNVALSIMHECFETLKDYRTKRDIVEDVIFSRSSGYNRLNYRGFYTVILEQNEELITAANVRIFGDKVAEMPLVGTRFRYRRLGMCRFLMDELERKLIELGVERLVLPAVPSVLKTWTSSFGFSPMTESERLQFLSYTFLDFQGTTMCQKLLQNKLPVNSTHSLGAQHENGCNKITTCQMSHEEQHGFEIDHDNGNEKQGRSSESTPLHYQGFNNNSNQQTTDMVNECDQDQSRLAVHISQKTHITHQPNLYQTKTSPSTTSNNLKTKTNYLDISNLKMYKRRASKGTIDP